MALVVLPRLVILSACAGQCLMGHGSDKTLCEIHCFSVQHVSPMTSKREQIQSYHYLYMDHVQMNRIVHRVIYVYVDSTAFSLHAYGLFDQRPLPVWSCRASIARLVDLSIESFQWRAVVLKA